MASDSGLLTGCLQPGRAARRDPDVRRASAGHPLARRDRRAPASPRPKCPHTVPRLPPRGRSPRRRRPRHGRASAARAGRGGWPPSAGPGPCRPSPSRRPPSSRPAACSRSRERRGSAAASSATPRACPTLSAEPTFLPKKRSSRAIAFGSCQRISSPSESWSLPRRCSTRSSCVVSITPPSSATMRSPTVRTTPNPVFAIPGSMPMTITPLHSRLGPRMSFMMRRGPPEAAV